MLVVIPTGCRWKGELTSPGNSILRMTRKRGGLQRRKDLGEGSRKHNLLSDGKSLHEMEEAQINELVVSLLLKNLKISHKEQIKHDNLRLILSTVMGSHLLFLRRF